MPVIAVAKPPEKEDPYRLIDQLGETIQEVEEEYFEPVSRAELLEGALRGLVGQLDPHSNYFNKEELKIFEGDTSGSFGGVGVEVDFVDGEVVVIAPIEGSPAARAGVKTGDIIVAVDGQPVAGKKPHELVKYMRGQLGTTIRLTLRGRDSQVRDVVLMREQIAVSSVLSTSLTGGIGYLRIKSFQDTTHRELLQAFGKFRKEEGALAGVILDLRNNPGGLVREAVAVADEFLSDGVIYTAKNRGEVIRSSSAHSGGAFTQGPLVVLVNEYSASAAELVAGAIKDHSRGTLVGAKTFGKGSVQTVLSLSGGAAVKLTTALYFTPSGKTLQARGVLPHVAVDPGYQSGPRFRVQRESDLEGHIGPDPVPGAAERGAPPTNDELHLGVLRTMVSDPKDGPDIALSVAFQIVRGELEVH